MQERHERNLLFISNGHGEDIIAARLIKSLKEYPDLTIKALPIVGVGSSYVAEKIPLIMDGANLPSGGFVRNGFKNLFMDLKKGLFGLTMEQIESLKKVRDNVDLAVCVGDVYLLILAGNFLKRPIIFLPTAKSDYISPHWPVEIKLMRRFCLEVFPRDQVTADSLLMEGLPAEFLGNIMMDSLDFKGTDLKRPDNDWNIAILPGSRAEAYLNMEDIAPAALAFHNFARQEAGNRGVHFIIALANGLLFEEILKTLESKGWRGVPSNSEEQRRGLIGYLEHYDMGLITRLTVAQGRFADILASCDCVIGMAGTANEQAVGLGKPVVTFVGRGPQFTAKFVKTQKRLLGEAISVVKRDPVIVAQELYRILTNEEIYTSMAKVGRERMGEPGGAKRIAQEIVKIAGIIN